MATGDRIGEGFVEVRLDQSRLQQDTRGVEQSLSRSLQNTGRNLRQTGAMMTRRLTMPIVALGAGIVKVAADFESSMNQVRAVTGATGSEFEALENQAKELGRTTQFSASEAADAMYFLASAGFDTNEVLGAMPGTLQLAAAAQMDLATAADIASNVLSGYQLEVEDLARVNDTLVRTFQLSNTNLQQLGEAMKYVAPVASGAGVEFEEAAAAIGMMGNAGIQGGMAGTSLRGAITRLLNPTESAAGILAELGVNAVDSSGNLASLEDIVGQLETSGASTAEMMEIFGQRAGPAMAALVGQGTDALVEMTEELRESGGTAETVADIQMEGMRGAMLRMKSAAEGAALAIADTGLLSGLAKFAENVAGAFQSLSEANPELLKLGIILLGSVAAAGPVLWLVGAALGALGSLLSPVGLVIGGLALLAYTFIEVVGEGDTFAEKLISAVDKVRDTVGPALDWVIDKVQGIGDWFGWTRDSVVDDAREMSNEAAGEFVAMWQDIEVTLANARAGITEGTEGLRDDVVGAIEGMRDLGVQAVEEMADEALEDINYLFLEARVISGEMRASMVEELTGLRDDGVNRIGGYADEVLSRIEQLEADGVEVTEDMIDDMIRQVGHLAELGLQEFSAYEVGATAILERLKAESGQITLETAQQAIEESARRRDETIAQAEEEYEEAVRIAVEMRDVLGIISAEEADDIIAEAERKRSGVVNSAETLHQNLVAEVRSMNDEITGMIYTATGEWISEFDRFAVRAVTPWANFAVGVSDILVSMATTVTRLITHVVNSALAPIRRAIEMANAIPGVNIDQIGIVGSGNQAPVMGWTGPNTNTGTGGALPGEAFHDGRIPGLRENEIMAILETSETVLTEDQAARLFSLAAAGASDMLGGLGVPNIELPRPSLTGPALSGTAMPGGGTVAPSGSSGPLWGEVNFIGHDPRQVLSEARHQTRIQSAEHY